MKVSIEIEATAQEMREFLGLPDIRPLQEELMQAIRENMNQGMSGFDPLSLMRPLFPAQMQSMELLQKAFWDAYNKTDGSAEDKPAAKSQSRSSSRKKSS